MKPLKVIVTLTLTGVLFATVLAFAQIAQPGLINYQGRLADLEKKKTVSDTLEMTFSIYDAQDGGAQLWTEMHPGVIAWGGVYNVLLGSINPIPEGIFWDPVPGSVVRMAGDRWLGVKVGTNSEMKPRHRIAAVAFAVHADVVDGRHATEFISSVHPDTMTGVEWCSDDTTMLTVLNECAGGGIKGECTTDIGVKGVGKIGVHGLASQAGDTAIYGAAEDPATQSGHLEGNVFINGDAQIGSDRTDYSQYLRIPGTDTWGYLYAPCYVDSGAVYIAYNYHVDATCTDVFDNDEVGSATSQIRFGDGGIELATGPICTTAGEIDPPERAMSVLPSGPIVFEGPISAPRATFDTVTVANTGWVGDPATVTNKARGPRPGLLNTTIANMHVDSTLGIGTPAPDSFQFHMKGVGYYGKESKGDKHIALFENTAADGGGIEIKVNNTGIDNANIFMSFLNKERGVLGYIQGVDAVDVVTSFGFYLDMGLIALYTIVDGVTIVSSLFPETCSGYVCPAKASMVAAALASAAVSATYNIEYQVYRKVLTLGVTYETGSGDYAEWLERLDEEEQMEPGDIVGVFAGKISKTTVDAQQLFVLSQTPVVVGNMPPEAEEHLYEKVAFMGQVPVKVSGQVKPGDYIIPSGFEDGTGIAVPPELMTADEFSKVVGRAWSGSAHSFLKLAPFGRAFRL